MMFDFNSYLATLNSEQQKAVRHHGSPLLILAGAGTGKTTIITAKIAFLVRERQIPPESILAVTFTNKAAKEMRDRAARLEPACSRAVIRTFHSFGAWFLRRNASIMGLSPDFVIYDDSDSAELLRSTLPQFSKQECNHLASLIARAKDYYLDPDSPSLGNLFKENDFRRIFAMYQERLRKTGNVDFGDLIQLPAKILEQDEAIARRTRQRFRVILVDEYQDSNVAQFILLQRLTGPETYVCVVGDDDQSIYRFRGAEVKNILSFSKVFPNTEIIRIEQNYRSIQTILDIAGNSVSHNHSRLGKSLRATKPGGRKPQIALLDDQEQEVEFCARIIKQHYQVGGRYSDIAILYRTNAQSLSFEKEFPRRGVPYKLVGALRFYEREEVKDVLAYLALIQNPHDEIAFKRIVNKPARGIGDSSIDKISSYALRYGLSLTEACRNMKDEMRGKGKEGLIRFLDIIISSKAMLGIGLEPETAQEPYSVYDGGRQAAGKDNHSLGQLIEYIIKASGLIEYHKSHDEIAGTQKLSNLDELISAASLYPLVQDGLREFLETIELDRSFQAADQEAATDAVTLITMHNTKGLEFPIVIVTGMEQGLFPRDDEEGEDLEEQRRLFYVAMTRAKDLLYLTACRWRRIRGRLFETSPSRFLMELDRSLYDIWGRRPQTTAQSQNAIQQPMAASAPPSTGSRRIDRSGGTATHAESVTSSEWMTGGHVYHDEYGQGVIIKVSMTESSGPLVIVQFETGKVAQFFPKYTKKLERISG